MSELDGVWKVERVGGALPPMTGVRKRIDGDRGVTLAGPVKMRFEVRGLELRYRPPFAGLVDLLERDGDGYRGRATFLGRQFGSFRLTKAAVS